MEILPPYSLNAPIEQPNSPFKITLSLETSHVNDSDNSEKALNVKLIPPEPSIDRTPVDICVVIDVSGSMGADARIGNEDSGGLTILDIVKHATNVIINTMTENDRLSIVSFTSEAKVELGMTLMDKNGQDRALAVVKNLEPKSSTNLWDGLYMGLETFRKVYGSSENVDSRIGSVFLLTDGMPNIAPPRGHLPMLNEYKDNFKNMPIINTFGFGYSLDSNLLHDIAKVGEGQYSFIPDASFVGTVFIHATTTLLTTYARSVKILIEATLASDVVVGGFTSFKTGSNSIQVEIGSILYGQSRDLIVKLSKSKLSKNFNVYVSVEGLISGSGRFKIFEKDFITDQSQDLEIMSQYYRLEAAGKIQDIVSKIAKESARSSFSGDMTIKVTTEMLHSYFKELQVIIDKVENANSWSHDGEPKKRMKELFEDLNGQVKEALESETAYKKWGQHYLPSLAQAHQLQICNNFKDPGVQSYIGTLGTRLRLQFDKMFLTLPPPTPSNRRTNFRHSYTGTRNPVGVPVMANFHNRNNPCFAGHCHITLADGSITQVKNVRKGDRLLVDPFTRQSAVVACVVQTVVLNSRVVLVDFNGLLISPFHPVFVYNKWVFPIEMKGGTLENRDCNAVYTFVLESVLEGSNAHLHTVVVEGVQCATLGHGLLGDVIEHDYLGTKKVLLDLKRDWTKEWNDGWIRVQGTVRDGNGNVCGFLPISDDLKFGDVKNIIEVCQVVGIA
ncbi:hypothetical protein HK096_003999 [Nowakowskiella sp. JEL0078]|nr:hypothetical protein HK096_003999 [Nowakowskiella sp. JEL0078]